MRTLGEPYKLILRYLEKYERQVIALMQGQSIAFKVYTLSYECAKVNWTEPFVLFTPSRSAIVHGAIVGGHDELFRMHRAAAESTYVVKLAAEYGRLKILKSYDSYDYLGAIEYASEQCHVECVDYILKILKNDDSDLINTCIFRIDSFNSRSAEMLAYLIKFGWFSRTRAKKLDIAIAHGNSVIVQKFMLQDMNPYINIAMCSGNMVIFKMILPYITQPFLSFAAKYNRIDMMHLSKEHGETDFDEAALAAIDDDHIDAIALLFEWGAKNYADCYEKACTVGACKIAKLLQHYATPQGLILAKRHNQEDIVDLINSKFSFG